MRSRSFGLPLLAVLVAALRAQPAPRPPAPSRPNFVFVITDDQRWDALGVVQREMGARARFPWFQTPHLDRLAREGARFRNAFVTTSLCSPSRAAFLTGRYGHHNGIVNNTTAFPEGQQTHATLLRAAGYTTGYVGKWHMGNQQKGRRLGFDYSASFVGQGVYQDCVFEVDGAPTKTTGWVDDASTDFALAFLRKNKDKPFSLVLGFKSSHGPWQPPARLADRFEADTSRLVPNLDHPAPYKGWTPPAVQGAARPSRPPQGRRPQQPRGDPSRMQSDPAAMQRNYFRTLAGVDENVGRLLGALDELGLANNTVVVFSSDNGYYLGEHGLGDKRSAYDEALRVPLLVRYPQTVRPGLLVDAPALNIDLAPTLLDLAGVPVPSEMQGRSWRPLLAGKTPADWRTAFFYEYFWERPFRTPTTLAVRTGEAKLIRYPGHDDWTELFDLKADPYETKNLLRDPAHDALRKQMEAEFERQSKAVGYRVPPYAHEAAGAGGEKKELRQNP